MTGLENAPDPIAALWERVREVLEDRGNPTPHAIDRLASGHGHALAPSTVAGWFRTWTVVPSWDRFQVLLTALGVAPGEDWRTLHAAAEQTRNERRQQRKSVPPGEPVAPGREPAEWGGTPREQDLVSGLLFVLGRSATIIDQLAARCESLSQETDRLRELLHRTRSDADRELAEMRRALKDLEPGAAGAAPAGLRGGIPDQAAWESEEPDAGWLPDDPPYSAPLVRPYMVTKGRSSPRTDLAVEALVSAVALTDRDMSLMMPEYHDIQRLCQQVRSVAEISALLGMPLAVARILIADMAAEALVHVHEPDPDEDSLDHALLEKVLNGLRKL
ncbi:hypothetical protein Misp01_47890 [Microtetraspora sp. NBRC 13810]|uniref:DUF742 domain-containing protein n=1 Tax=Microtetraspora sp. NBRC 13810 TaxID=3030990 RepID=UPI0024A36557|nr:DUF742 domain-containing protein [Microtetraspora sp. NBRC 13810]GLW09660.1 hypothetical protein Misp01_47890 [Microtetraspora sp. NBRC 13810]